MPNATLPPLSMNGHQDPDAVLRDFAADLNARGLRAVGMVQAGQCADCQPVGRAGSQRRDAAAGAGFRLPAQAAAGSTSARLQNAGARVADALEAGADLVIVNRFGKRERDGKGLAYLIERALDADIPVVIAVSSQHFADWIKFADGMSVKLHCDRAALQAWWNGVSASDARAARGIRQPSAKSPNKRHQVSHFPPGTLFAVAVPHAHENDGLWRTSL